MSEVQIVGCGVDMLVLNVYYANSDVQPLKQVLDGDLQHELEEHKLCHIKIENFPKGLRIGSGICQLLFSEVLYHLSIIFPQENTNQWLMRLSDKLRSLVCLFCHVSPRGMPVYSSRLYHRPQ